MNSIETKMRLDFDWQYNVAGVYNYNRPGQFQTFFDFVRLNHDKIEGDILEAGVYRGNSLVALGLLLRELGSDKKVYGYDSFSGFPPVYHAKDELSMYDELFQKNKITREHLKNVKDNIELRSYFSEEEISVKNISKSTDFSETNLGLVQKKIDLFGLDNVILVEGAFDKTMRDLTLAPEKIFGVLMDCDLYESYCDTFRLVWPKLQSGGLIYLDEYYSLKFPGARIATDEFIDEYANESCLVKMQKDFLDFERWHIVKI